MRTTKRKTATKRFKTVPAKTLKAGEAKKVAGGSRYVYQHNQSDLDFKK